MTNLSPEQIEELRELCGNLATQDNACTAHPYFIVQSKRRVYGFDTNYGDASNTTRVRELEAGLRVCNSAIMPNDVIESIREEWGNTNVAVYKHNSDAAREEIKKLLPPFPNTGETA